MKKVRIFGLFGVCRNGEELAEGYRITFDDDSVQEERFEQPLSMGEGTARMLVAIRPLLRLSLPFERVLS